MISWRMKVMWRIVAALAVTATTATANADWELNENFSGSFEEPWVAGFDGAPNGTFETLDGAQVFRMTNTLDAGEQVGYIGVQALDGIDGVLEARFNTLTQDTTRVDGLFRLSLRGVSNPGTEVVIHFFGGDFSESRIVGFGSSFDGSINVPFDYQNNTWYRFRIVSSGSLLRASVYDDTGAVELIGHTFSHSLADLDTAYRPAFSQFMGLPNGLITDAAVDRLYTISEPDAQTWYRDVDGDGYGNPNDSTQAPEQPTGYVADNTDCDDNDPAVNPGATEICDDGTDNDCDGLADSDDADCGEPPCLFPPPPLDEICGVCLVPGSLITLWSLCGMRLHSRRRLPGGIGR